MISRFCKLSVASIMMMLSGLDSPAQESQSEAGKTAASQVQSKVSKTNETGAGKNETAATLLTREHVALTNQKPQIVENVEVPKTSFIREWYRVE